MKNDEKIFHVFYDFMNGKKKLSTKYTMNEGRNFIIYRVNFNRFILFFPNKRKLWKSL